MFDQPIIVTRQGVQKTRELSRIASLPRRKLDIENATINGSPITDLTPLYLKLGGPCSEHPRCPICAYGPPKLWPAQSVALLEAERGWGLFGPMGVGVGKTLVTLLLPDVFDSRCTVLLVPAALRNQLLTRDMAAYGRHFHLPIDRIKVVAYTQLSDAKTAEILEELKPDLIISDEAHSLARAAAARTKRFIRYMKAHPDTRFCALSGTVTRRSLRDYAHLVELSLRAGSPVPGNWSDLNDWADALDPISNPLSPGALKIFAEGDLRLASGDPDVIRVAVREGYRRRLVETSGVVATSESWEGASLIVEALQLQIPATVNDAIATLKETWEIEDEELEDMVRVVEVARQLAMGFYYRWCWPNGIKDMEWLKARAAWHKQVRAILQNSRVGLDSPLLVARAAQRGQLGLDTQQAWETWRPLSKRYNPTPPIEAVWIDKYAIEAACDWAVSEEPAILWYSRQAVGEALEEAGVQIYGAGTDAGEADPAKQSVIACSIASQGTGKNLQRYSKNLVMEPPASGAVWEQCLDSMTEILTEDGWKGIDDEWLPEIRAAAFSIESESISWSVATRMERKLGDEKMFGISNPHLDIRVTSGHRVAHQRIRRFGHNGEGGFEYTHWKFEKASALPQFGRIPVAGDQRGAGVPLTEAELVFIGLFMTDGNLSPGNNAISLFQSERYPEIIALIESTLKSCRFRYGHRVITTPTNFGSRKNPLHRWSISYGAPKKKSERYLRGWSALRAFVDKDLSDSLKEMTSQQLRALLKGMWAGDGDKKAGTYSYDRYQSGTMNICTKRKHVANKIQSLCVRRGMRCNISELKNGLWMLRISDDRTWTVINMSVGDRRPRWKCSGGAPNERVWCVEVDTGAIVTRRNGKVAIVGNCIGRTHRPGQQADEVMFDVFAHTGELMGALYKAVEDANYVQQTQGQRQKILCARRVGW